MGDSVEAYLSKNALATNTSTLCPFADHIANRRGRQYEFFMRYTPPLLMAFAINRFSTIRAMFFLACSITRNVDDYSIL